jgi:branched-chain amino acid transport system ATP-binding protein
MALIRSIPQVHGCGILLIEHNMALVLGLCDRIHVLDGGRTLAEGTPAEVRADRAVFDAYLGAEA